MWDEIIFVLVPVHLVILSDRGAASNHTDPWVQPLLLTLYNATRVNRMKSPQGTVDCSWLSVIVVYCPSPPTFMEVCMNDDVIKWKHFPRYWPFVWGMTRSFDVSFDLRPINGWVIVKLVIWYAFTPIMASQSWLTIFVNKNVCISPKMSLEVVPKVQTKNIPALVQIMA